MRGLTVLSGQDEGAEYDVAGFTLAALGPTFIPDAFPWPLPAHAPIRAAETECEDADPSWAEFGQFLHVAMGVLGWLFSAGILGWIFWLSIR